VVLILNTRRKIKGHYFVSVGTMDTILCHPREVFRLAVMASASAIIVMHNHPSGESTPSEADIKSLAIAPAGQVLKLMSLTTLSWHFQSHLTSGIGILRVLKRKTLRLCRWQGFFETRFAHEQ